MARPRSELIVLERTPFYHCIARCVRRSFLCGQDEYTGQCFDHRKQWIVERIKLLGDTFAINIAAYAVMSNHYHLVLHVHKAMSERWSRNEVIHRWLKLYRGPVLAQRYYAGDLLSESELFMLDQLVEVWRNRLTSISWFMARLNEYIAREANKEDDCKGRFWESRFISRGLEDMSALLSCMAYVDLNPIRAGLAETPISSEFTSVQQRLLQARQSIHQDTPKPKDNRKLREALRRLPRLMPFTDSAEATDCSSTIPCTLKSYIELVDCTGRSVRPDKKGHISAHAARLLADLELNQEQWLILSLEMQRKSISMLNGLNIITAIERSIKNKRT